MIALAVLLLMFVALLLVSGCTTIAQTLDTGISKTINVSQRFYDKTITELWDE